MSAASQSARAELARAIEAHRAAEAGVGATEETLSKANNLLCRFSAQLAEYAELDEYVAVARARNLKIALESPDENQALDIEPTGFAAKRIGRDNIAAQYDSVRASIPVLEQDVRRAREAVEDAAYEIELCRERIFCAEAAELAQDYMQRLAELRRLSYRLRFMAARSVKLRRPNHNGAPVHYGNEAARKIDMDGSVIDACHENPHGDAELRGGLRVRDAVGQAVNAYWLALRVDPFAQFGADKILDGARQSLNCRFTGKP